METQVLTPHPSIGGSYKYGWQQMKKYFLPLLLVMLVLIIAEIPASLADYEVGEDFEFEPVTPLQVIGSLYWLLILPVFQYGAQYLFLKAARNQEFQTKEIFSGFKKYLNVILAYILVMVLVGLGLILFIIPGIIVICRLVFVPYIIMDTDLGPVKAVERSWAMTKGHGWTIFGMGLLAIPVFLAGLLLLLIGVIFAAMLVFCAFASIYQAVSTEQQDNSGLSYTPAIQE